MEGVAEGSESAEKLAYPKKPGKHAFPRSAEVGQLGADYDVAACPLFTRITEGGSGARSDQELGGEGRTTRRENVEDVERLLKVLVAKRFDLVPSS